MEDGKVNQTTDEPNESVATVNDPVATGGAAAGGLSQDDRTMGMLCHLLGFFGLIGPLIIWLVKKDQSSFVDQQGKESLNFHITVAIVMFALVIVSSILAVIPVIGWLLSIPLYLIMFGYGIFILIQIVMASMKANSGISYTYPLKIAILK